MASNDFDPAEIDLLVKELAVPKRAPAPSPAVTHHAAAVAPEPATDQSQAPGRRYSTATLLMPAERTEPKRPFAFASAINLPSLPRIPFPSLGDLQSGTLPARMWVGLGVVLSAAMPYWPYAHAWSWGLLTYFLAMVLVVITGIWGAKLTWDARLPAAHTVSVGTVVWGLGLLASETVPRIVNA